MANLSVVIYVQVCGRVCVCVCVRMGLCTPTHTYTHTHTHTSHVPYLPVFLVTRPRDNSLRLVFM